MTQDTRQIAPPVVRRPLLPPIAELLNATTLLWEWLCRLDEPVKARTFLESLPYVIDDDPVVQRRREMTDTMLGHLESPAHYAWFYDAIWEADPPMNREQILYAGMVQERARWALERLRAVKADSVLDLGAGSGFLTLYLALHGFKATGINLTERCVPAAREVAERLRIPATFVFDHAEAYRSSQPFDAAVAFEIVEHVADPDALVASMEANVKPGGLLMMTTPNGSCNYGEDYWEHIERIDHPLCHVRAYTERRMREWLGTRPGFTLEHQAGIAAGLLAVTWRRP